jgi:hypothetical protein
MDDIPIGTCPSATACEQPLPFSLRDNRVSAFRSRARVCALRPAHPTPRAHPDPTSGVVVSRPPALSGLAHARPSTPSATTSTASGPVVRATKRKTPTDQGNEHICSLDRPSTSTSHSGLLSALRALSAVMRGRGRVCAVASCRLLRRISPRSACAHCRFCTAKTRGRSAAHSESAPATKKRKAAR